MRILSERLISILLQKSGGFLVTKTSRFVLLLMRGIN
nr:MAG TPA: hypothetical protein [Caudoviricetes sp.]